MTEITLRDYLAAHAGTDVPRVFVHVPAPGRPERPESLKALYAAWELSKEGDDRNAINDAYHRFATADSQWKKESDLTQTAWFVADCAARVAQWRYFQADAMLAARAAKGGAS